jgi:predicted DNA-binding transcriptional regulator AlpA
VIEMLTRQEAGERTGLGEKWLRNAAWRGDGPPFYRFNSRTCRYSTEEVDAWVAAHRMRLPKAKQQTP